MEQSASSSTNSRPIVADIRTETKTLLVYVPWAHLRIISPHRMHDIQTIATYVLSVTQSVCLSRGLTRLHCVKRAERIEIHFGVNTIGQLSLASLRGR